MTPRWDPNALAQLDEVATLYRAAGIIDFARAVVTRTWTFNRSRWEPDRGFDDANTLGYQTSRNVNNCIAATFVPDDHFGVRLSTDTGIAVMELDGYRLRVVKSPIESGLSPNFEADFDWSTSATRSAAARRNAEFYYPLYSDEWVLAYENDPRPSERRQIAMCRDIFLVWAADIRTDKTAGWIGIPRTGDVPWIALRAVWPTESGSQREPEHPIADYVDVLEDDDEE